MSHLLTTWHQGRNRTICEVHREIYRVLAQSDCDRETKKKATKLLKEAFTMAKKMGNKLNQYFWKKDKAWYIQHRLDGATFEEYMEGPE